MRIPRLLFLVCACCVVATAARAQDDEPGSKDHPMFSRMPGYYIGSYDEQGFGSYEYPLEPPKQVEGKFWKISYQLKEGAKKAGPLQTARNYTDLVVKRGGKKLSEEVTAGGGWTVATLPVGGGRTLWLEVEIANGGDTYDLIIVEEAAMKQDVEFTAGALAEQLKTSGSVAVHGILFDTAKATIRPESAATLQTIADALKAENDLKIEIQGHTDNVGAPAANLKLSQDRAAAVKAYLVRQFGIAADRLTTVGFGDTKPATPNTSEEGRAQNRRVELVRK